MLNMMLAEDPDESKKLQPGYTGLNEVKHWHFLGIMRNDMQLGGKAPGAGGTTRHHKHAGGRMINVDVRGSTRVFNYWPNAQAGQRIGLSIVKCNRENYREYDPEHHTRREVDMPDGDAGRGQTYHQVLPTSLLSSEEAKHQQDTNLNKYVCGEAKLPLDLTTDIDVGFCFQFLGTAERVSNHSAALSATVLQDDRFKLPVIPIFTRI